jgi:hypothetical protein
LEAARADNWVARLSQFQRPVDFLKVIAETKAIPNEEFLTAPMYRPLLEAWAAGHFAYGLDDVFGSIELRLESDRFPDFVVRLGGNELSFELTIADKPERRRDLEYQQLAVDPLRPAPYEPARGQREGPVWIANAVKVKFEKHYHPSPHLLVYANFEADTLPVAEVARFCARWRKTCRSIWVLWSYQIVQLFDSEAFGATNLAWRPIGIDPWGQGAANSSVGTG